MSVDAIAAVPPMGLPEQAHGALDAPGGLPGAEAGQAGGLATPDAALPALGLEGAPVATDTWAQAHAETAPWGSPADELAAGGQLRGLTEMAREMARGSHALRSPDGATPAPLRTEAGATPAEGLPAHAGAAAEPIAPHAALLPGAVIALHPGVAERLRPGPEDAPATVRGATERERGHASPQHEDPPPADGGEGEARERDEPPPDRRRQAPVGEPLPDAAWCAPLLAALQQAARQPAARAALQAAADAWTHGRAVLLACPAAAGDAADAWLFVLRPAPGPGPLRLSGERLAARLRWAQVGGTGRWWQVRVAKSYSLRRGGQLVTQDEGPDGRVSCELQLGPFPAVLPRWREVLVRVDLAQRLWQALGTQWSLPLLVCDQVLLDVTVPAQAARGSHA